MLTYITIRMGYSELNCKYIHTCAGKDLHHPYQSNVPSHGSAKCIVFSNYNIYLKAVETDHNTE